MIDKRDHNLESEKKFWWLIFATLLAMCGMLFYVMLRGEAGDFHGIRHPTKADMMIGGPAVERTGNLIWIAGIFGALQLVFFVSLLARGFRTGSTAWRPLLWGGGVLYILLFAAVLYQYNVEIHADANAVTGLPRSTWLAIFVLWPCPYVFVAAYALGFKRFIYSQQIN